jgi:hypothetical protein
MPGLEALEYEIFIVKLTEKMTYVPKRHVMCNSVFDIKLY